MAERRSSWHKRCQLCKINKELCFCEKIKTFKIQTQIQVIIHHKEKFLPSNTAHLLARNFPANLKMVVRGEPFPEKRSQVEISPEFSQLYLYPDESAVELNQTLLENISQPIELIVPDGTWRQVKKVKRREKSLKDITSIKLPGNLNSTYSLRQQKYSNGLCTYEAVAKAIGIIEGGEIERQMMEQFQIMNSNFKLSRPF